MICKHCRRFRSYSEQALELLNAGFFSVNIAKDIIKTGGYLKAVLSRPLIIKLARNNLKHGINRNHALFHVDLKKSTILAVWDTGCFMLEGNHRVVGAYLKHLPLFYYFLDEEITRKCFSGPNPPDGKEYVY